MKTQVQTKRCARISERRDETEQLPVNRHQPPGDERRDPGDERGVLVRDRASSSSRGSYFTESRRGQTAIARPARARGRSAVIRDHRETSFRRRRLAGDESGARAGQSRARLGRELRAAAPRGRGARRRKNLSRGAADPQRERCRKPLHLPRIARVGKSLRAFARRRARLSRAGAAPLPVVAKRGGGSSIDTRFVSLGEAGARRSRCT